MSLVIWRVALPIHHPSFRNQRSQITISAHCAVWAFRSLLSQMWPHLSDFDATGEVDVETLAIAGLWVKISNRKLIQNTVKLSCSHVCWWYLFWLVCFVVLFFSFPVAVCCIFFFCLLFVASFRIKFHSLFSHLHAVEPACSSNCKPYYKGKGRAFCVVWFSCYIYTRIISHYSIRAERKEERRTMYERDALKIPEYNQKFPSHRVEVFLLLFRLLL